jgi:hypothetical protein
VSARRAHALIRILGMRKAKSAFTTDLANAGLISSGLGHAGTEQKHFKNERAGKIIHRPRVWSIDLQELGKYMARHGLHKKAAGSR